ncbi:MAG: carcinine hydrolase/isopenicillin-N N-acyltransferase family protein [Gammaproteobacteria bacterium]|nr:carcinine hydrolase/isopenicillin-N N-acyltransferase family protein [Gammaproteobacteria bacterium]
MKKLLTTLLIILFSGQSTFACTTFASVDGANQTTLIAKNRDEHPDIQSVVAFHPNQGYSFLGMVSQQKSDEPYIIRSGINEYGLAIVNMATPNPPANASYADGDAFMRAVLTQDKTVAEVLGHLPLLIATHLYPEFYLLADRTQTASIELAPQGKYFVTVSNIGPLYHTNNYEFPAFFPNNIGDLEGSTLRYNRISALMNSNTEYTLNEFKLFSHDHHAGSNDSIFRTGKDLSDPNTPRTLATFIASIPHNGSAPSVSIEFYPKGCGSPLDCPATTYILNSQFWDFPGTIYILKQDSHSLKTSQAT